MKVIAFGHRRRVGKDTAVGFLKTILQHSNSGMNIRKGSFASALKDTAHMLYGWAGLESGEFYDKEANYYLKEKVLPAINKSPRDVWIELGNYVRQIYEFTWVDILFQQTQFDIILISDLRYPNEAERILALGGTIIKIDRPEIEQFDDVADSALKDWTDWTETWVNDGDLNGLYKHCQEFAETLI
jgi:hypothetical protein